MKRDEENEIYKLWKEEQGGNSDRTASISSPSNHSLSLRIYPVKISFSRWLFSFSFSLAKFSFLLFTPGLLPLSYIGLSPLLQEFNILRTNNPLSLFFYFQYNTVLGLLVAIRKWKRKSFVIAGKSSLSEF